MDANDIFSYASQFERSQAQYEILDVDDGRGNVDQVIVTNAPCHDLHAEQVQNADELVGSRYGRYRPLMNGNIVLGPESGKIFISWLGFTGLICILIFLYDAICNEFGVFVFYLGPFLCLLCMFLLCWTGTTDPGVIPRDFNLNQYLLEIRHNNISPPIRPRWCRKCQSARPPRCYHCRECDICVRRQDMHLLVGGICIGSRNFRQYFAFNITASVLSLYLICVSIILIIELIRKHSVENVFFRSDFNLSCFLLLCGATVLSFPQTGLIMFVYRLYLLGRGSTVREEYRAYLRGNDYNPFDHGILLNLWEFLGKPPDTSCFRRKKNQIDPHLPPYQHWRICSLPRHRASRLLFGSTAHFLDPERVHAEPQSYIEKENLRQHMNVHAKVKSHLSLPLLDHGELPLIAGTRFRLCLYPKPFDLLQQQIKQYHLCQALPKSVSNARKFKQGIHSLSESCLCETVDASDIVHQARAHQIQQIIGCVIRRDRLGLIELARRVDVAGLIGMERFDPDDIQMIELTNGLPLITARSQRRTPQQVQGGQGQGQGQDQQENIVPMPLIGQPRRVANASALGIPQMVAAGLMPTIRRQQQQVAATLAISRLQATNPLSLWPPIQTMAQEQRPRATVPPQVFVPRANNRQQHSFRYDQYNRRRFGLIRPNATNNTTTTTMTSINVEPPRPRLGLRTCLQQKTVAALSNNVVTGRRRNESGLAGNNNSDDITSNSDGQSNPGETAPSTGNGAPSEEEEEVEGGSHEEINTTTASVIHDAINSDNNNAVCVLFVNTISNNQIDNPPPPPTAPTDNTTNR